MSKLGKIGIHLVLFILISLVTGFIVTKVSELAAIQEVSSISADDGAYGVGIMAFGTALIIRIIALAPMLSTLFYYIATKLISRAAKNLDIRFFQKLIVVFVGSLILSLGVFTVITVGVNRESGLQQQEMRFEDNFFYEDISTPTPQKDIDSYNSNRTQMVISSMIFGSIVSMVYAMVNTVWFGIYEAVRRVIKKLNK